MTEDACRRSCLALCGVIGTKSAEELLPRLGGGVGVLIRILTFTSTEVGSKGINPVALKPLCIVVSLNAYRRASGYAERKSSLSIWLMPFRVRLSISLLYARFRGAK